MPKKHRKSAASKIIKMRLNAKFFYEKAVESLDRNRYDKALKYFRRVVEYEYDNPVNHCNLAGILSEMGRYAESNKILEEIVERIDPSMTECYFYMANNYANMEDYESAVRQLVKYLENDPHGYYLEECEEMLEFLSGELDRPVRIRNIKSRENFFIHDKARLLLEEGRFHEAVRVLEMLLKKYPDFTAARNNLALAYHYAGDHDKAFRCIEEVLDAEPGNVHALCNLALFFKQAGKERSLARLLETLRKVRPLYPEHAFKLGITSGVLGDHEAAYRQFVRLLSLPETAPDPALYHYAAVAAYNTGKREEAEKWWKKAKKLDRDSLVAGFYLAELSACRDRQENEGRSFVAHYYYHLPFVSPFLTAVGDEGGAMGALAHDPLIMSSVRFAMEHGDLSLKLRAIDALCLMETEEAASLLKAFAENRKENPFLKSLASFALGRMQRIDASAPRGEKAFLWQEVPGIVYRLMPKRYGILYQYDLFLLWNEFVRKCGHAGFRIIKPEAWAGALEYLVCRLYRVPANFQEIAARYGVSVSAVRSNAKRISDTCALWLRMQKQIPSPFKGGKEDV